MITVHSDDHRQHFGKSELIDGVFHPSFECPDRADRILASVRSGKLGQVVAPGDHGIAPLLHIHDARYIAFLQHAWARWTGEGNSFDLQAQVSPLGLRCDASFKSESIYAQMGQFSADSLTPVTAGTWQAAYTSAQIALSAKETIMAGARSAFALCRPPGHHAASAAMGGFCYLNNAAIAAQSFLDSGAARVSILDVDYHHGNGTQEIFYTRPDVQVISIHCDPVCEFPFYWGHEEERGARKGEGYNLNYPLPAGTEWAAWGATLSKAMTKIVDYAPDFLIVSLGVDTYKNDPISKFRLETEDFLRMGELIGSLRMPTLFVQEGGYALEGIGANVTNVLSAFLDKN